MGLTATSSPTSQIPVNSGAAASGLLPTSQGASHPHPLPLPMSTRVQICDNTGSSVHVPWSWDQLSRPGWHWAPGSNLGETFPSWPSPRASHRGSASTKRVFCSERSECGNWMKKDAPGPQPSSAWSGDHLPFYPLQFALTPLLDPQGKGKVAHYFLQVSIFLAPPGSFWPGPDSQS